ncbi:hypothetical protein JYU34_011461 [Plutella xylostella]|uniref:Gamma tubulin complex component C-terminal domain-containing protein n=1 Tax=Plutella xylostella TaxID=51655 RepID=A0ABQ7QH31_PLUXY|nr:hypothetical protein JYU34_011461 [Plutella xylostella]
MKNVFFFSRDELNKPASSLYVHNLSCTLEAAVRATNAQFEPPHVLSRLHVNLYPNCDGRIQEDSGWDVFALQYRVDGPLGTLFPAACAARYRLLFTQLWRVKRLEHALHDAWRRHAILNKRLKYMPEVWGLMRRVSCLRAEALRLCSALQEAGAARAEPAWAELLAGPRPHLDALLELHLAALERHPLPVWARLLVGPRPHLDALLELHLAALERQCIDATIHHTTQVALLGCDHIWLELIVGPRPHLDALLELHLAALERQCIDAMIHHTTQELQSYLGNVLNETLALRSFETTLHAGITAELDRRQAIEEMKGERVARGEYAFTAADEAQDKEKRKIFLQFLANRKADLNLALHAETSLQTLAFRLDYSDYYKRGDAKLHEPLTYQHKRMSEIGLNLAKNKVSERSKKK